MLRRNFIYFLFFVSSAKILVMLMRKNVFLGKSRDFLAKVQTLLKLLNRELFSHNFRQERI